MPHTPSAVLNGIVFVRHAGRTSPTSGGASSRAAPPTPREMVVLRELAVGKSNKEIGSALGVVEVTVKVHVERLYEKLGVGSRTEALAAALERGLLRPRSAG